MSVQINKLHPHFAVEVVGLDASRPDPALCAQVQAIMDTHAVAVLRDQTLDDEQQIAFSRCFGELEVRPAVRTKMTERIDNPRVQHNEIFDVSNLDQAGRVLPPDDDRRSYALGNQLWHTDSSFRQLSATWSLLSARIVSPVGADTEFADTRAAYDALPEAMRARIDGLVAEHSIWHSRARRGGYQPSAEELRARPPARHRLVRTHPGSGRKALYIAMHASHIIGWPDDEGRDLLDELIDFATRPEFVYAHKWRLGDLVIWDNRCTMHRATPFDDLGLVRDMRRTTVREAVSA